MKDKQYNWINVSGGKDSTALLLWSLEQPEEFKEKCRYVYADTKHEHPAVYKYLSYLEFVTGVKIERIESEGFLEMCKRKQRFPSVKARFCTEELKIKPMAKHMDSEEPHDADHPHMVYVGIRREESPARARLTETTYSNYKYPPRKTSWQLRHHPLLDWYVQDVFDIHKKYCVEPNPLYKMGMHRVGCFPCIMTRHAELRTMFKRFPEVIDRIEDWEKQVSAVQLEHKGVTSNPTLFALADLHDDIKGIRDFAGYLDRGEELPGLEQDFEGCMSIYGLCE